MAIRAASRVVRDILDGSPLPLTGGTNLFSGLLPEDADSLPAVGIIDSGGIDPQGFHAATSAGFRWDQPTFQVTVRGQRRQYDAAIALCNDIRDQIHGLANHTPGDGTKYVGFWLQGDINFVRWDENQHPEFTLNFRTIRGDA